MARPCRGISETITGIFRRGLSLKTFCLVLRYCRRGFCTTRLRLRGVPILSFRGGPFFFDLSCFGIPLRHLSETYCCDRVMWWHCLLRSDAFCLSRVCSSLRSLFAVGGLLKSLLDAWLLLLHFRSVARYYGVVPCVASLVRGSAITT